MSRRLAPLAVAALLGLGAAAALAAEDEPPAAQAEEAAAPADETLNPLAALAKETLEGFREAPLFTPSRKRPKPPPAPVFEAARPAPPPEPPAPEPAPELKLSGVAMGPEGAVAIVQEQGATRVERLRLGDQIGGWLVTGIDADRLKLTLDDREQMYRLFERSEKSSAAKKPQNGDDSEDEQ